MSAVMKGVSYCRERATRVLSFINPSFYRGVFMLEASTHELRALPASAWKFLWEAIINLRKSLLLRLSNDIRRARSGIPFQDRHLQPVRNIHYNIRYPCAPGSDTPDAHIYRSFLTLRNSFH